MTLLTGPRIQRLVRKPPVGDVAWARGQISSQQERARCNQEEPGRSFETQDSGHKTRKFVTILNSTRYTSSKDGAPRRILKSNIGFKSQLKSKR